MPALKTHDVSVYRTQGLGKDEARDLGQRFVADPRGMPLLGAAYLSASDIRASGVDLEPTQLPHPRHANIVGWPGDTQDRAIAIQLAELARLELY